MCKVGYSLIYGLSYASTILARRSTEQAFICLCRLLVHHHRKALLVERFSAPSCYQKDVFSKLLTCRFLSFNPDRQSIRYHRRRRGRFECHAADRSGKGDRAVQTTSKPMSEEQEEKALSVLRRALPPKVWFYRWLWSKTPVGNREKGSIL